MEKENNLSDEIFDGMSEALKGKVIFVEDAKEKIQNAQRRINEVINMEWSKGMKYILDEMREIFKEEFGEELTK